MIKSVIRKMILYRFGCYSETQLFCNSAKHNKTLMEISQANPHNPPLMVMET